MSICHKRALAAVLALIGAGISHAPAQRPGMSEARVTSDSAVNVTVPAGVPLSIASIDAAETEINSRGGALLIDLRCTLSVRNTSKAAVRSVSFSVFTQEGTIGGKASVAVPSLNVAPDGTFPVRLNLRLLRPLPAPENGLVSVVVDGVLLSGLTFFGPDKLDSRRRLMVWEMEADRDRAYFKAALAAGGKEKLREEILASFQRQQDRPRLQARPAGRGGRVLSSAARARTGNQVALAFLDVPESPLEALSGFAMVDGRSSGSPQVTVRNRSRKAVRYFEMGWLVDDADDKRYAAGSLPGPASRVNLGPGQSLSTSAQQRFVFFPRSRSGDSRFAIKGMTGYVSHVLFEDDSIWIPSRESLDKARLLDVTPPSPEEQRLTGLYLNKGLDALVAEIERF